MEPGSDRFGFGPDDSDYRGDEPMTPAVRGPKRARVWLILFTAFVTEVVLIAAVANQYVVDKIANSKPDVDQFGGAALASIGQFGWRVTKLKIGPARLQRAEYAMVGVSVVLAVLLVWALVRGPITWLRTFVGTWLAVIVAAIAGGYVKAAIYNTAGDSPPSSSKVWQVFFSVHAPGTLLIVAAGALGLVVALITSLVAVVSRRDGDVLVEPVPVRSADAADSRPPWGDRGYGPPAPRSEPFEGYQPAAGAAVGAGAWGGGDASRTAPLPETSGRPDDTSVLPRFDKVASEPRTGAEDSTSVLPTVAEPTTAAEPAASTSSAEPPAGTTEPSARTTEPPSTEAIPIAPEPVRELSADQVREPSAEQAEAGPAAEPAQPDPAPSALPAEPAAGPAAEPAPQQEAVAGPEPTQAHVLVHDPASGDGPTVIPAAETEQPDVPIASETAVRYADPDAAETDTAFRRPNIWDQPASTDWSAAARSAATDRSGSTAAPAPDQEPAAWGGDTATLPTSGGDTAALPTAGGDTAALPTTDTDTFPRPPDDEDMPHDHD